MTAESQLEAYNELRDNGQAFFVNTYEDADRIIEALEKQIPKEPSEVCYTETIIDWTCGRCGRFHRNDFKLNYCSECGQKIKWE